MKHIGTDVIGADRRGGAPEEDVAHDIVRIDFAALAVDSRAIEKAFVRDQVDRNAFRSFGAQDRKWLGAMAELGILNIDGGSLELLQQRPIPRQDEDRRGADLFERERKRANDIAEPALLGPWRNFCGDDRNFHFETATCVMRKVTAHRIPREKAQSSEGAQFSRNEIALRPN